MVEATIIWEMQFPWVYYSPSKLGWFCNNCEECSDTGDQYWKTNSRKYDEHPHLFFTEHIESSKHIQSFKNNQEVKQILKKGGIVRQILKGAKNKTVKEKRDNRKTAKNY